jgi:acetylornithine deacetylase
VTFDGKPDRERLLQTAADIVPFHSFSGNESQLADWIAERAKSWGGLAEVVEIEPGRRQVNVTYRGPRPGRKLALNGHLDIDPLASGYKRDPWKLSIEGNHAYGAGMFNMRGGVCSMIETGRMIHEAGGLTHGELVLQFVAGELQGGIGTKFLLDRGDRPDAMINPEPWGFHNIITVTSGVLKLTITVVGFSTHTSSSEQGINAITKMARLIDHLPELTFSGGKPRSDLPPMPRINPGAIIGGRGEGYVLAGSSFVPDRCSLILDIRYLEGQTAESIESDVRAFLEKVRAKDPEFSYFVQPNIDPVTKVQRLAFPPCDVPLSEEIVQLVLRLYREQTGQAPRMIGAHYPLSCAGCDMARYWEHRVPSAGIGPGGAEGTPADPDNSAHIDEMLMSASLMARAAAEFCSEAPAPRV